MKKPVTLSGEEKAILLKLSNDQLRVLSQFKETAAFIALTDVINMLIDIDKNIFFSLNEGKIEPVALACEHAYVRGGIAKNITLQRIIHGCEYELRRRDKEQEEARKATLS